MVDFGYDLSCTTDLDPLFRLVTGATLMEQVALHRLFCRQGRLLSNPVDNTIDCRDFISEGITRDDLPRIQGLCQSALVGDPRIFSASVQVSFDTATATLTLNIRGVGSGGPFELTIVVSAVTVEILRP